MLKATCIFGIVLNVGLFGVGAALGSNHLMCLSIFNCLMLGLSVHLSG